jgi:hypothetical protein
VRFSDPDDIDEVRSRDRRTDSPPERGAAQAAAADTLRLTAYQYVNENPGSDLADTLSKRKDFEAALQASDGMMA